MRDTTQITSVLKSESVLDPPILPISPGLPSTCAVTRPLSVLTIPL